MSGAVGVLLEPGLVGVQHRGIVADLVGRFSVDPQTGRWVLGPGRGGLVLLVGESGAGKSRIVRELYRGLRAGQSLPGYWPVLGPSGGATAPAAGRAGVSVFGFRKNLGPDVGGMVWPARAVPDFLWWHVACQTASNTGFLDAEVLFAHQLLAHREPANFGWARAKGQQRWVARAPELLARAGRSIGEESVSEASATILAEVAGQAVPFGGLITKSLRTIAGLVVQAGDQRDRLSQDTLLGVDTGGVADPTDALEEVINSLAMPGFPVVVAVEDVHDADPGLLDLLRRLAGPAYADRVLVVATGWPGALASRHVKGTSLGRWLADLGAQETVVEPLASSAVADLVGGQFPDTAPDRVTAIAARWTNPLAIGMVLDLLVTDGATSGAAITATDEQITEIPTELAAIYDLQLVRLPDSARQALMMDVICAADPQTATNFRTPPGPDASWSPVEGNWVTVAGGPAGIDPATVDHATAVAVGWLVADGDWVSLREPGLADAAWRGLRGHGLRQHAPTIRGQAARVLAEAITAAARHGDGTPGLFLGTGRSWTRESGWMLTLAPALPDDPNVQNAAARAALELFQERAQVRPQEAIRGWAAWAPRWEAVLGPDHPDTLASRNTLAGAYRAAGDLGRAIPLYEQNLTDTERVLGPDHPDTLTSRGNLAGAYEAAGDLGRAIPLYEQNLTDTERVLGPDHPDTLTSRGNLAGAYQSAGDLGRAIPLLEQTLADRMRVLGPDHPQTLTSRNNLAGAYQSAGDLGRAIPLLEQTLADRMRVLGPDHPQTLTSRGNLAYACHAAGDLGRAIPLYEQTLADRMRVLGPDHPQTLTSRNNLGHAFYVAGDLGRAIPLYEQTLADSLRVLGPDHPQTLTSRNNLAGAYREAGDLGRAIPLYEQTLTDRVRVLGPDHPDTLVSRNNLAGAYESAGDLGRAIPLYEQTLADMVRVLGPDHPKTLTSRNNLAYAYESAGDLGRAIPLLEAVLTDRVRVLGPDHPDTLTSRNSLAAAHQSAGDLGRAIPLLEAVLTDRVRVLGPDHPNTVGTRGLLSAARAVAGIPKDDATLVEYWMATPTWGESFNVLDAAESRLRGPTATTTLAAQAEAGDPAAVLHTSILRAVDLLSRQTVYAAVTDPGAALAAAADAGNAGQYRAVSLLLDLNPQAGNHPTGLAIFLTALGAAADPDLPQIARQVIDAGIAPAVLDALPQIAELLHSEPMQNAVTIATNALHASP